jgi:ABC-type cobalamin/Fe3+-siderophores transport system ATPase subunit
MAIIKTNNLSFGYGEKKVLSQIDFSVPQGSIVSLIGPNGSGKSTLLRCLAGLLKTPQNTVFIEGQPIERFKTKVLARKISFLPQFQENFRSISVYDLVAMGRAPYHNSGWYISDEDKEKIEWALKYMSLTEYSKYSVNTLSGGEKQRVLIAMALAQDASVLLLDEPVTYMDLKYQQELLSVINDLKHTFEKTIVAVFHDINHAMGGSDFVYMLKNGRIYAEGPPEEVLTEISISSVYDTTAHVCQFEECCWKVVVPERRKYKKRRRH